MIDLVGRISCEPMPAVNEDRKEIRYLYQVQTVLGEYLVLHQTGQTRPGYPFVEGDTVRIQGLLAPQKERPKTGLGIHASRVTKTPVKPRVSS